MRDGEQLRLLRRVDAVEAGVHGRRAGDAHVHLGRAGLAHHLHDLQRGRAAHDRIVDEHDALAGEHVAVGVVLEAHAHVADRVGRLDEGAADIVVADDAEIEGQAGRLGEADRRRRAGIGHRHDEVGRRRRLARELGADPLAHLVDAAALDDRIGPGEIDVLEDAEARLRRPRTGAGSRSRPAVMITISPGSMSRTKRAPMMSSAQVSEARIGAPSRSPRTSGRTPSGSRQPIIFFDDRQTSEQAPSISRQRVDDPVDQAARAGWWR